MKIYVNEMPTESKKCLFARKEKYSDNFVINTDTLQGKRVIEHKYYCNIDRKLCDLENGCQQCNKLRVLMK